MVIEEILNDIEIEISQFCGSLVYMSRKDILRLYLVCIVISWV